MRAGRLAAALLAVAALPLRAAAAGGEPHSPVRPESEFLVPASDVDALVQVSVQRRVERPPVPAAAEEELSKETGQEALSGAPHPAHRNCSDLVFSLRIPCIIQQSFTHGLTLADFKIEAKYIVAIWAAVYGVGLFGHVAVCNFLQHLKTSSRTRQNSDPDTPSNGERRDGCQVSSPPAHLWDADVAEQNLRNLRFEHALLRLAGWRQLTLAVLAVLAWWLLTCVLTALVVDWVLAYASWEESSWLHDPGAKFNPMFQALQVIGSFTVVPLGSVGARMLVKDMERRLGAQFSVFATSLLHAKALRLPAYLCQGGQGAVADVGQLQLHTIAGTLGHLPSSLISVLVAPFFISVLLVLLWRRTGRALATAIACALPALAMLGLVIMGLRSTRRQLRRLMHACSVLISETLANPIALKSCGWEDVYLQRVMQVHQRVEGHLVMQSLLTCLIAAFLMSLPRLFAFSAFLKLDTIDGFFAPHSIFACLVIVENIVMAASCFQNDVSQLVSALSLSWRIEEFLRLPEAPDGLRRLAMSAAADDAPALRLRGNFRWSPGSGDVLHGLDVTVPQGALVAVLGEASAGKTAFLHVALGELYPSCKEAIVEGPEHVAFCGHESWVNPDTLRQNVLMGTAFSKERYRGALEAAALEREAAAWPRGDLAPLGAAAPAALRARVALARAACGGAGAVLLDDPLQGVDEPSASATLLQRFLGGPLLKDRTRILAVRRLDAALLEAEFDWVILLAGGCIQQQGRPSDVIQTPAYQALCRAESLRVQCNPKSGARSISLAGPVRCPPAQVLDGNEAPPRSSADCQFGMHCFLLSLLPWRYMVLQVLFAFLQAVCALHADVQLARWADDQSRSVEPVEGRAYLLEYGPWQLASFVFCFASFACGAITTVLLSKGALFACLKPLLAAPIDVVLQGGLPLSSASTCLSNSMAVVHKLPARCSWLVLACAQAAVQLAYIHRCVPLMMSFLMLLMYFVIYWVGTLHMRGQLSANEDGEHPCLGSLDAAIHMGVAARACNQLGALRQAFSERLRAAAAAQLKARPPALGAWNGAFASAALAFLASLVPLAEVCLPGCLGLGTMGLCLTILQLALLRLPQWLREGGALSSELASLQRLREFAELPAEHDGGGGDDSAVRDAQAGVRGVESGTCSGSIEAVKGSGNAFAGTKVLLSDLVVAYARGPDALRGISLAIEAGQRVCLLGPAGAGKTTLLLAVLRLLRPKGGHVLLNGAAASGRGPARRAVGFVPALPPLFLGTLRQNLDPADVFTDTELMKVLADVQLGTCVAALPSGIDEWIGRGEGLNFEQQRMLCVARAALHRPGLLLVDAPKPGHDAHDGGGLRDLAISVACSTLQGATVLAAARRLEAISVDFDRFAVLQDGIIVESGPAEEACKAHVLRRMQALRWPR